MMREVGAGNIRTLLGTSRADCGKEILKYGLIYCYIQAPGNADDMQMTWSFPVRVERCISLASEEYCPSSSYSVTIFR
jgi:hypothetical protein